MRLYVWGAADAVGINIAHKKMRAEEVSGRTFEIWHYSFLFLQPAVVGRESVQCGGIVGAGCGLFAISAENKASGGLYVLVVAQGRYIRGYLGLCSKDGALRVSSCAARVRATSWAVGLFCPNINATPTIHINIYFATTAVQPSCVSSIHAAGIA